LSWPPIRRSKRRLAAPRIAHDRDELTARDLHVDPFQDRTIIVGEIDVSNLDQAISWHNRTPEAKLAAIIPEAAAASGENQGHTIVE
jgi:hypothetical protein